MSVGAAVNEPCELHVWGVVEGIEEAQPVETPVVLSAEERSSFHSLNSVTARLNEVTVPELRLALGLADNVPIIIHNAEIRGFADRNARIPLSGRSGRCQYDWVWRASGFNGPPPNGGTIFFREFHGQFFYRSYFRSFDANGTLIDRVDGQHRGRLPVIGELPEANRTRLNRYLYDTADGTRQLAQHMAEKIRERIQF